MPKGDRRERQARELYERAGWAVQAFYGRRWGETDGFSLFDFVALRPEKRPEFVQVKSNRATGIESYKADAQPFFPWGRAAFTFLVCHDREGWRLIDVTPDSHACLVDERDKDYDMGEGIVGFLS